MSFVTVLGNPILLGRYKPTFVGKKAKEEEHIRIFVRTSFKIAIAAS
jgi:hypothetical protein